MNIFSYLDDPQLQIRVDLQDLQSKLHYQYANQGRWRMTPYTTAEYLRDQSHTTAQVYEFFDRQWRGC